jgi:predicted  nucleic acid-binding Zn-ribbon protein
LNGSIGELNGSLTQRDQTITQKNGVIGERDDTIRQLESEIKRLLDLSENSGHEAGELSKRLSNLTKLLAEAEAKIQKI